MHREEIPTPTIIALGNTRQNILRIILIVVVVVVVLLSPTPANSGGTITIKEDVEGAERVFIMYVWWNYTNRKGRRGALAM